MQEQALRTLTGLEYLRAMSTVYRNPLNVWTWPHMLRQLDSCKSDLTNLLIAYAALASAQPRAECQQTAEQLVTALEDCFGGLRRPQVWRRRAQKQSDDLWEQQRSAAYAAHRRYREAVARDLQGHLRLRALRERLVRGLRLDRLRRPTHPDQPHPAIA
jgi:hypothetical protein